MISQCFQRRSNFTKPAVSASVMLFAVIASHSFRQAFPGSLEVALLTLEEAVEVVRRIFLLLFSLSAILSLLLSPCVYSLSSSLCVLYVIVRGRFTANTRTPAFRNFSLHNARTNVTR